MNYTISTKTVLPTNKAIESCNIGVTNLAKAQVNREYIVKEIKTNDRELRGFLFTLGCYEGEKVTVLSELGGNYVIAVKDAKYCIDSNLAEAIIVAQFFYE